MQFSLLSTTGIVIFCCWPNYPLTSACPHDRIGLSVYCYISQGQHSRILQTPTMTTNLQCTTSIAEQTSKLHSISSLLLCPDHLPHEQWGEAYGSPQCFSLPVCPYVFLGLNPISRISLGYHCEFLILVQASSKMLTHNRRLFYIIITKCLAARVERAFGYTLESCLLFSLAICAC